MGGILWRLDSGHVTSLPNPGLASRLKSQTPTTQTRPSVNWLCSSSVLTSHCSSPHCSLPLASLLFLQALSASGPCTSCSLCWNALSLDSCMLLSLLTLGLCLNDTCQRGFSDYLISNNCPLHLHLFSLSSLCLIFLHNIYHDLTYYICN